MGLLFYSTVKRSFKKVSHVLFDLDGLILDSESIYKKVVTQIAKEHGKVYTKEIRLKVLGMPDSIGSKIAVKEIGLPMTPEQFLKEYKSRSHKLLHSCPIMPGAEKLIRHLHKNKVPMAIATSSSQDSYNLKTNKYKELFSLFNPIVTGGSDPEVKNGKPSPDIFLVCASRFSDKPEPSQCLVLEDSPNGVTAAISAGMQCVMIPEEYIPVEATAHATLVLNTLEDLKLEEFGLPPIK